VSFGCATLQYLLNLNCFFSFGTYLMEKSLPQPSMLPLQPACDITGNHGKRGITHSLSHGYIM